MSGLAARALALFDEYVEWSPARRKRALTELAIQDPALHKALYALLESDASDLHSVLDRPAAAIVASRQPATRDAPADDDAADPRIGTRLGAWRIHRLIANGGMGTVYEAHRDDEQYQQRVALKCIRAELVSPELVDALCGERNLLAQLDHPGIVPLLDGGVDDGGHPWFAMRFVDGVPIDIWCDNHRAGISLRIELLLQACDALAYAHAQGVIHQDIKPSNLLVTPEGRVQVVDFGIASTFSIHDGDARPSIALSRDYCAPESRIRSIGAPVTDLYSMGVLMYRLLCGQWPTPVHEIRELAPLAGLTEPMPMTRLLDDAPLATAIARAETDVAALRTALAGDLTSIALKAVATRPEDRYASINALADDLHRWRKRLPVSIREGERLYRTRKFLQRNLLAVAANATIAVAVVVGAGIAWQQHVNAVREANATILVNQLFASTLGTATLSGLGNTPFSSGTLLERTELDLRQLPLSEHPEVLARGLATLARSYALLGKYRHASKLAEEAQRTMGDGRDEDGFILATRMAMFNNYGHSAEAARLARDKLEQIGSRDDDQARQMRLTFGTELAKAQWGMGRTNDAIATIDGLLTQVQALPSGDEEAEAELLVVRAGFLLQKWRHPQAEADARRAMTLARPVNPVLADDALELMIQSFGRRHSPDSHDHAQELKRRRQASLGASHPKTAKAALYEAWTHYPKVDIDSVIRALEDIRLSYGEDDPNYAIELSRSAWTISKDARERVDISRKALATLQDTVGDDSAWTMNAKTNLALALSRLDGNERRPEDVAETVDLLWDNIHRMSRAGIPAHVERIVLLKTIVNEGDRSKLSQVDALIEQGKLETLESLGGEDGQGNLSLLMFDQLKARLLYLAGAREESDRQLAAIIERHRDYIDHPRPAIPSQARILSRLLVQSFVYRALHAFETCHPDRARALLREGVAFSQTTQGEDDGVTRTINSYLDSLNEHGRMLDGTAALWISASENQAANERARACGSAATPDRRAGQDDAGRRP